MDLARADALFYEDLEPELESPNPLEGSEDDDTQKELEEMLYSRVYHESSSVDPPSSLPEDCPILDVNIKHVNEETPAAKSGGKVIAPSTSSSALKSPSFSSEFSKPSRPPPARYYDVNQDVHNSRPIFVAPTNPDQKGNSKKVIKRKQSSAPSALTSKLLARSSNEQSYMPTPKASPVAVKETEEVDLTDSPARSSSLPPQNVSKVSDLPDASSEQRSSESTVGTTIQRLATSIPNLKTFSTEPQESGTSQLEQNEEKTSKTPENVQSKKVATNASKKSKLQTFEAKVSKVLSSMLDEESRSSLEENHVSTQCAGQDLNDSGWSVGMSWADMSSKYSFGVDSIEEESVSSLQLHDTSFTADSRANTPDVQTPIVSNSSDNDENKNEEGPEEPSRYELQLKDHIRGNAENPRETDSESEVGSIVEVAPPVKPPPDLVDISDGEYTPAEPSSKIVEHIIDSSDDDIVVLNVIDASQSKRMSRSPPKAQKRQSITQTDKNACGEHTIPHKRSSYHQEITIDGDDFAARPPQETHLLGTSTPMKKEEKKMNRLDKWLFNPIKSSKYLDHEKYLAKMSNDPSLWQLCRADITKMQYPRGPKCVNCNDFGHKTHACRKPRKVISCHMCGQPGHTETRCKEKMCLRCGTKNSIFTDRCRKCTNNSTVCEICSTSTHSWKTCPDLWRRYHLTTSNGNITQPLGGDVRPRSEQWCSNCASRGHLSHECRVPHWKCETISPFVKSYAEVDAEENHLEGVQRFSVLLTDDAASVLDTEQGKDFLKSLSVKCQVAIHTSFDIMYKKLSMEGSTLAIEEVRSKVMQWTSPKEVSARRVRLSIEAPSKNVSDALSSNAGLSIETTPKSANEKAVKNAGEEGTKNVTEESSKKSMTPSEASLNPNAELQAEGMVVSDKSNPTTPSTFSSKQVNIIERERAKQNLSLLTDESLMPGQTICDAWHLPPSLPKKYDKLAKLIEEQLKFIDFPMYCNQTVGQIYMKYRQGLAVNSKAKQVDVAHYSRILSIILLGKCGFREGPNHVAALRNLLQKLREKKGHINTLYKDIVKHFNPLFRGKDLNHGDCLALVKRFYSDETLVKRFDSKNDDSQSASDSNPIDSNVKAKKSPSLEENNSRSIKKSKINVTPLKKSLKKYASRSLLPMVNSEKKLKQIVPFVVKNLSSRFIFSYDRTSLEKLYATFCKKGGPKKEETIANLCQVIEKLCKSYNIKLPVKLLT